MGGNKCKIEEWISLEELARTKCLPGLCENWLQTFSSYKSWNNRCIACSDISNFEHQQNDQCYSTLLFAQRHCLLGMYSFYLILKLTTKLHNKHL